MFLLLFFFFVPAYRYESSVQINAPAEKVWPYISSMKEYNSWDPFSKEDPTVQIKNSGTEGALGDSYRWIGEDSGQGRQTITKIVPYRVIETYLNFLALMESNAQCFFNLAPTGK